jgi:hypothetical protein
MVVEMDSYGATGTGSSGQIVSMIVFILIIFLVLFTAETVYNATVDASQRFVTLMDYTANAESMPLVIHQDAAMYKEAKVLGLSMNERTGIEFAYSFFMYVNPSTFTGDAVLKHVFHKGYGCPWPLMGPGVFLHGHENTMRVFMNTYKNPYTHCDIKNIPVQKWFHVVLNCYKKGLDIYINGKLANRISFKGTLPYQNFQDIVMFSSANYNNLRAQAVVGPNAPATENPFQVQGAFKGQFSKFIYTRYALSAAEIDGLMRAGPAPKMKEKTTDQPPYFADDWWRETTTSP